MQKLHISDLPADSILSASRLDSGTTFILHVFNLCTSQVPTSDGHREKKKRSSHGALFVSLYLLFAVSFFTQKNYHRTGGTRLPETQTTQQASGETTKSTSSSSRLSATSTSQSSTITGPAIGHMKNVNDVSIRSRILRFLCIKGS